MIDSTRKTIILRYQEDGYADTQTNKVTIEPTSIK